MTKKVTKTLLATVASLAIIALLITWVIQASAVGIFGRCTIHVEEYEEFYIYKKQTYQKSLFSFGGGAMYGYKVWFLPGQKSKMLSKVKQDIHDELTVMVENNSDLFKGYEIDDDFCKIYVYYYKDARNRDLNPNLARRLDKLSDKLHSQTVELKIELIGQLIHGYGNSAFDVRLIDMVELEEHMP